MAHRCPRNSSWKCFSASCPTSSRAKRNCASCGARRIHAQNFCKDRSEEHTSELQSQSNLVCRLLLEKKKKHELHFCYHDHDLLPVQPLLRPIDSTSCLPPHSLPSTLFAHLALQRWRHVMFLLAHLSH